jgi:hypothetical protein
LNSVKMDRDIMSSQKTVIELIKRISGQSNILTIPRIFIHLTGDIKAALFLSQCVYWSDKTKREDGFFYKCAEEWEEETGLTRTELTGARKRAADYVETKVMRANGAPTLHYRVDFDKLANSIFMFYENQKTSNSENPQNDLQESSKSDLQESSKSLTETTHEITQETTKISAPVKSEVEEILSCWRNLFPNKPQPRTATFKAKIETRLKNQHFRDNWKAALERAHKSPTCLNESWFNFEFFIRNDTNYQKMLDGWMGWKDAEQYGMTNGKAKQIETHVFAENW